MFDDCDLKWSGKIILNKQRPDFIDVTDCSSSDEAVGGVREVLSSYPGCVAVRK